MARSQHSSREDLNRRLGRESAGEPVHIATESADLNPELKRGLSSVGKQSRGQTAKEKAA